MLDFRDKILFDPPEPGCVPYLPGLPSGGSKLYDRSPYSNIGTVTGATWKRLPSGLSYLDFDGSDDKVVVGNPADWKWLHGADDTTGFKFTILFWMFVTDLTADDFWGIVGTGGASSSNIGVDLWLDNRSGVPRTRRIMGLLANGSGTSVCAPDAGNNSYPNDTNWHQLAFTYDQALASNNATIYLDVSSIEAQNKSVQTPSTSNPTNTLNIGAFGGGTDPYYGGIALFRIYRRVLSVLEIQNHFNREKHLFGVW